MKKTHRMISAAAALAIVPSLLVASPASAIGSRCDGSQVRTCAWVKQNADGSYAGRARVTDVKGDSRNFDVKTTSARLQYRSGGTWKNFVGSGNVDADGWHNYQDNAASKDVRIYCGTQPTIKVRAQARFDWRSGGSTQGEWMSSQVVTLYC